MKVTLHFTKSFTRGILEGMNVNESMRFVDIKSAFKWVGNINDRHRSGDCEYRVSKFKAIKVS